MNNTIHEWIKEHCHYCPESLYNVSKALLSVQDDLDYNLQYELDHYLAKYVIAAAKVDPEGLGSILKRFPLDAIPTMDMPNSPSSYVGESSLQDIANDIKARIINTKIEERVSDVVKVLVENSSNTTISETMENSSTPMKTEGEMKFPVSKESMNIQNEPDSFRESISIISEASNNGEDTVFNVRMIQSGKTLSRRFWPDTVLREAIPLFEGKSSYINHPVGDGQEHAVQTLCGWFDNVNIKEGDGLYADWHLLNSSPIKETVLELNSKGKLDLIGLSLLGTGQSKVSNIDGQLYREAISINSVRSVDVVDVPGSGGYISQLKESLDKETIEMLEGLEKLTLDELKAARPDLFEESNSTTDEVVNESQHAEDKKETVDNNTVNISEAEMRLTIRERNYVLEDKLRESNLPNPMKDAIRHQFSGKVFEDNELDSQIKVYREVAAEVTPPQSDFILPNNQFSVIDEADKLQAAMDKTFGLEVKEELRSVPGFSGIREAYLALTGDTNFSLGAIQLGEEYREALPTAANVVGGGTITFSNVLGTSINRRLVRQYRRQNMWWRPIVTMRPLQNLKQQDANRLESLGALTERTTGGAEYTELTWAEQQHNWTPTEFGNVLPVSQRAIINDDLMSLTRAADEIGRSAGITLNAYINGSLTLTTTDGNGTGPTFVDKDQTDGSADPGSTRVFNSAQHNNKDTAALSRSSWKTADQALRGMIDASGYQIGVVPKYLVYPHQIRETAYQILASEQVPDSANNARNIYAQDNLVGIEAVTLGENDSNNWFAFASPDQLEFFEFGFLNGREEPEFWVQSDPTTGYVFSHDVIMYKIRQRYGGGYVDYRGAYASIVP